MNGLTPPFGHPSPSGEGLGERIMKFLTNKI
jgi:hypothetical protein